MTIYRKLSKLEIQLNGLDWVDLQEKYPTLAKVLQIEVAAGATAQDVFHEVFDSNMPELAGKMQRAAAYLIAQAAQEVG